ncbi:MAG TPA: hypothetical protein VHU87_05025 [Rhizomicrobium sp.]|jgi:hypothetical protein|nr:hypothetical protein [Rhizomicrobium sp.]
MQIMLAFVTATALLGGGAMAVAATDSAPLVKVDYLTDQAQIAPRRLIVAIDLSKSNPLIDDPSFAQKVAARVADEIRGLGFASEVHVRTFGSYDADTNNFHYDVQLSVRNRPDAVAAEVAKLIAGTPMLVRSGRWKAQDNTNILAFLDNVSEAIGCSGLPTTVILASDGIEDSEYARLERSDSHLPLPTGQPFAHCAELQILGLGEGTGSPSETVRLRSEWARWARQAGFARFQGLNDW